MIIFAACFPGGRIRQGNGRTWNTNKNICIDGMEKAACNMALFASGNGTNVQRICEHFAAHTSIHPAALFCNNPRAFVLERASELGLPSIVFTKKELADPAFMLPRLQEYGTTHVVLAGFLAQIPGYLIKKYPRRIINIHPALLPKFGGKGMYGMHVHEAVVRAGEKQSGISVHLVDEHYDHGQIFFQARVPLAPGDSANDCASKIHILEQTYFPLVIEAWVKGLDKPVFPVLNQVETEYTQTL